MPPIEPDGSLTDASDVALFHVWDFLSAFKSVLMLKEFSFEAFRAAITSTIDPVPLIVVETHLALMRAILTDVEHKARKEEKKALSANSEASVPPASPAKSNSKSPSRVPNEHPPPLSVGDLVEAQYANGTEWYRGIVIHVHGDEGGYDIRYEDGDEEARIPASRINVLDQQVPAYDPPSLIPGTISCLPTSHMLSPITWQEVLRCTVGWMIESGRCNLSAAESDAAFKGCEQLGRESYSVLEFSQKAAILKLLRCGADGASTIVAAVKSNSTTRAELRSAWHAKVRDINKRADIGKKKKEDAVTDENDGMAPHKGGKKSKGKTKGKKKKKRKGEDAAVEPEVEIVEVPPDGISPHEESDSEEEQSEEEESSDEEDSEASEDDDEDAEEDADEDADKDAKDGEDEDGKPKSDTLTEEEASRIVGMSRAQMRKLQLQKRQEAARAKELERIAREQEELKKREEMEAKLTRKRTRDRRYKALEEMKDAYKARDLKRLESAIEAARASGLEGGTRKKLWRLPELDLAIKQCTRLGFEYEKEVAAREHHEKMSKYPVYRKYIGSDREGTLYWWIPGDVREDKAKYGELALPGRIYAQKITEDGAHDTWTYFSDVRKIRDILNTLFDGGIRERNLKKQLQLKLRDSLKIDMDQQSARVLREFDPEVAEEGEDADIPSWATQGHKYIGKRIRRVVEEHVLPATVVAFRDIQDEDMNDEEEKKTKKSKKRARATLPLFTMMAICRMWKRMSSRRHSKWSATKSSCRPRGIR